MAALSIATVQQRLTDLTPEFAKTLPPGMTPEKFGRVALTAMQNTPSLLTCEPQSLWNACMAAAQDGLLPDGREGKIINRGGRATWQPMVQGIIAKAKRRGAVTNLVANIVYQGEQFDVLMGDDDRIVHRRDIRLVKRGKEIAVYAIASLRDGTKEREVMTWEQVQAVRRFSQTPNAGPWVTSEDEMARKTVVRRLAKRLPALDDGDADLHRAIERVDELYQYPPSATAEGAPKPGAAIDAVAEPEPEPALDAPADPPDAARGWVARTIQAFESAITIEDHNAIVTKIITNLDKLRGKNPALAEQIDAAERASFARVVPESVETPA